MHGKEGSEYRIQRAIKLESLASRSAGPKRKGPYLTGPLRLPQEGHWRWERHFLTMAENRASRRTLSVFSLLNCLEQNPERYVVMVCTDTSTDSFEAMFLELPVKLGEKASVEAMFLELPVKLGEKASVLTRLQFTGRSDATDPSLVKTLGACI